MNCLLENNYKYYFLFFIAILISLFVHWPIIFTNNPVDIDHHIVISPIENINSIEVYQKNKLKFFDVQPVRDIVLKLQALIKSRINFQIYTLINWLLVIFMSMLMTKTLKSFKVKKSLALIAMALFVLHPLLSWVIYWPTAQKHLLSCFFICLSSFFCFKKYLEATQKYNFKIWLFYLLSIFSQPITIFALIPYIFIFYKKIKNRDELILLSFLVASFFLCLTVNMFYYSQVYPIQANVNKIANYDIKMNLANSIFSFSRSFTQIFFPLSFSINYVKASILSFVGLPFYVFIAFRIFQKYGAQFLLFFFLFTLFPLFSVYSKITNIFISDTYLVWSLLSLIGFSTYLLHKLNLNLNAPLFLLIFLFSFKTYYESSITGNNRRFFSHSYQREPTCKTAAQYLNNLRTEVIIKKKIYIQVTEDFLKNNCYLAGGSSNVVSIDLLSIYFFLNDKLPIQEKIRNLESVPIRTLVSDSLLLILVERIENHEKAMNLIKRFKQKNSLENSKKFRASFLDAINPPLQI